jgi:hypothetical protein
MAVSSPSFSGLDELREGRKGSNIFKEEDSGKKWSVNKVYTDFIADTERSPWHLSPGQLFSSR